MSTLRYTTTNVLQDQSEFMVEAVKNNTASSVDCEVMVWKLLLKIVTQKLDNYPTTIRVRFV